MEDFENGLTNSETTEQSSNAKEPYFDSLTNQVILPNGNKMALKELHEGYLRQQDYTKKTTATAEDRKQLASLKENLGQWNSFLEGVKTHPKGKEIQNEFNQWWNQIDGKYFKNNGNTNGQTTGNPQGNASEGNQPIEALQTRMEMLELQTEASSYEQELGRPLTKAEKELAYNAMWLHESNAPENTPPLSFKQAHQIAMKQLQSYQKELSLQKKSASSVTGSANGTGMTSTKKPPSEMTSQERKQFMMNEIGKIFPAR